MGFYPPSKVGEDVSGAWEEYDWELRQICLASWRFLKTDKNRTLIEKATWLTYDEDPNEITVTLIPCALHQAAHPELTSIFARKVCSMGPKDELVPLDGTLLRARTSLKVAHLLRTGQLSSLNRDWLKPVIRVGEKGWPTVVIESGLAESLSKLRENATFWLSQLMEKFTLSC